jgi:hypothetical protein
MATLIAWSDEYSVGIRDIDDRIRCPEACSTSFDQR